MSTTQWSGISPLPSKRFTCGHCSMMVAQDRGFQRMGTAGRLIYPCPACDAPTYFEEDKQVPGVAYGNAVDNLPPEVASLYAEARNCLSVSAPTASVLACRKLRMNVAVTLGAPGNRSFQEYVNYLSDEGYVPPNAKGWVNHIRDKGNEATHQIPQMKPSDAEVLITFMEMILKLAFDFPSRVPK
jgi:hypothetical protein